MQFWQNYFLSLIFRGTGCLNALRITQKKEKYLGKKMGPYLQHWLKVLRIFFVIFIPYKKYYLHQVKIRLKLEFINHMNKYSQDINTA